MKHLNMRYVRLFMAVAEDQNYHKAARRLHTGTAAPGRAVRCFEQVTGVELVTRHGCNGVELTAAGRSVYDTFRRMLGVMSEITENAQRAARGEVGQLRVAYNSVAEHSILAEVVRAFEERASKVRLTLMGIRTPEQLPLLADGKLDVGFVCTPIASEDYDVQELTEQPFVAAIPARHRLASEEGTISYESLHREPLVLFSSALDPDTHHQLRVRFHGAGATMNVVRQLDTVASILRFVADGHGCSIVPEYAAQLRREEDVVFRALGSPVLLRRLAICKPKTNNPLAEWFIRCAKEHVVASELQGVSEKKI
jgi:DNA-binding transcriptional LysR family regulator